MAARRLIEAEFDPETLQLTLEVQRRYPLRRGRARVSRWPGGGGARAGGACAGEADLSHPGWRLIVEGAWAQSVTW